MSMKFKGREAWIGNGDLEVYDASGKFDTPTVLTVHEYRTKRGRRVLKLVKAAPLLLDALQSLVNQIDANTCRHEETHRGGAIWEICDHCGEKWADDQGGKPEFVDSAELIAARAAIAAATN